MFDKKSIFYLLLIMSLASIIVTASTILILYKTYLSEVHSRLGSTAKYQAGMIEALADDIQSQKLHNHTEQEPLHVIIDEISHSHLNYKGFEKTSETVIAMRHSDQVVFLYSSSHDNALLNTKIPFNSDLAVPMREALLGFSGITTGKDYKGNNVIAAYEPVKKLAMGVVVKIDSSEVKSKRLDMFFYS